MAGSLVHNERTKLLAGAVNNIALAFVIGGAIAPVLAGRLSLVGGLFCLLWFGLGGGLHLYAQYLLGRLQE